MSHLTQLPFSGWGLLLTTHTSHWGASISLRSPFNNLTTAITLVNVESSAGSPKHLTGAGVDDQLADKGIRNLICVRFVKTWWEHEWLDLLKTANGCMTVLGTPVKLAHLGHVQRCKAPPTPDGNTASKCVVHVHFDTLKQEHFTPQDAVTLLQLHTNDQHRSPAMSNAYCCTPAGTRLPSLAPGY